MKVLARIFIPIVLLSLSFYAGYSVAMYGRGGPFPFGHHRHDKEAFREERFERMSRKLQLNPEQRLEVRAIFEQRGEKLRELRSTVHPQFQAIRKETQERILAILNPEQKELFKKFLEKKKRWREKRRKSGEKYGRWLRKNKPPAPPAPDELPPRSTAACHPNCTRYRVSAIDHVRARDARGP